MLKLKFIKLIGINGIFGLLTLNCIYFNKIDKKNRINLVFDLDETLINSEKSKYIEDCNMNLFSPCDYVFRYMSEDIDDDDGDCDDVGTTKIIQVQKSYDVWIRPFVKILFSIISKYNNLYLMTNADIDYANDICDYIGINKYFIDKKFYDDIQTYNKKNNLSGKDLEIFGSSNTKNWILIDDLKSNSVKNQKFIHISPYSFYRSYDVELIKLFFSITYANILHIFEVEDE